MALECEQGIVTEHADTIVGNSNEPAATGFHIHTDLRGACIERVFKEFFDYGSGTLHHLAGRDFVRDYIGEYPDSAHVLLGYPLAGLAPWLRSHSTNSVAPLL